MALQALLTSDFVGLFEALEAKYKSMFEASVSAGHSISEGTLQKWKE